MNESNQTRIGKFDSAQSLFKAYESLLSEFTKRCQRLKEIEKENLMLKERLCDESHRLQTAKDALGDENFISEHVLNNETIFIKMIEKYISLLNDSPAPQLLGDNDGAIALCPSIGPKDLKEAKRLADIMINS